MEKINSYRDLEVWQKAMELVTDIYKVTYTNLHKRRKLWLDKSIAESCCVSSSEHS